MEIMTASLGNSSETTINLKNWTKRGKNCLLMLKMKQVYLASNQSWTQVTTYFSRLDTTFMRKIKGKMSVTGFFYR